MEDKINEIIETSGEQITQDVASPAARRLIMMNENVEKLLKENLIYFTW